MKLVFKCSFSGCQVCTPASRRVWDSETMHVTIEPGGEIVSESFDGLDETAVISRMESREFALVPEESEYEYDEHLRLQEGL